jgi:hypothetical protein
MSSFRRIPPGAEFPVSATLYVTYLKCPQQALARLQGVYSAPSVAAFRGSLAHRIFARHLVDGPIAAEDFTLACKQEAGTHLGSTMASLGMKPSEFRSMTAQVKELYGRFEQVPSEGFEGAEVQIESEPAAGITIRGRVDAVFADVDGKRIVDWKTGSFLDDADPQLDFYAMAWQMAKGTPPARMEVLSLKTGEKRVSEPTDESIAQTAEDVAAMIENLRDAIHDRAEMARTAGPYCRWCPLLDDCDEGAAGMVLLNG